MILNTLIIYSIAILQLAIMQGLTSIIPQKSPNDKRTYQALTLSNKLKLLLIHDNEIVKSACSISVGVGSLHDKQRSLGLAHFLQHMLFMGSKKYPQHNQYSSFISTNSGLDNAYTSDGQTNYYYEIKNNVFYQAAQRLINFFNGALLNADCIQKQTQAVHQQYILWTNDDSCRKWEIIKKLASQPYCRFSIGNIDTLRNQYIREDLVQFYQKYYSANIINAVVCSNYSIEDMKNILIPLFQSIPNKNIQKNVFQLHFNKSQTSKFIRLQSIRDETILQFFFVVQYLKPLYKKHVSDYISHIVGHEGKNSLLSILKNNKYASQLSSYTHDIKSQTIIGIQIKLTQQGQQQYQKVYNIVMDYLSTLKSDINIFEQIKQKKHIQFEFQQKQRVSSYVCRLSSKLHDIPIQQILNYQVLFDEYDQNCINRVLAQLNPFNVIVVMSSSQELENPIVQKYLGGKYLVQELPQRSKSMINFESIPKNKYIPINTKVYKNQQQTQKLLTPTKINENIYFLHENIFNICKGGIQLKIYNKQNYQFMQFYSKYINLLLKQLTYPAQTLQCKVDYQPDDCVIINIFGFSDTVVKVLEGIAEQIGKVHDGKKSSILFEVCLNDLIEQYQNTYNQQSDQVAETTLQIILQRTQKTVQQSIKQFKSYNYKEITKRIKQFWKTNIFKWVVVGNFEQQNMTNIITEVQNKMKGDSKNLKIIENGCLKLKQNIIHQVILQSEQLSSSCAIVYYQVGPYSEQLYYKLLLLKNHIDEPYFNQLRTLKQMAYYLAVKIQNTRGILGLYFILVSSTRNPMNISDEIKSFVHGFFAKLTQDLTGENQAKFKTIKQSVFTKVHSPHNNLKAFFEFITKEITEKTYFFTRKQQNEIRRYLDNIQVADLEKTWSDFKNNTLQVYVVSKAHQEEYSKNNIKSQTIQSIKNRSQYWNDLFQCS